MTVVINSNSLATLASGNLSKANHSLRESLVRLSSGKRIVTPADDAAGLSVAYKLKSKSNRNGEIRNNLSNTKSFLDVQQGALQSVGIILSRMAELKTMSLDVTKSSGDNENYDKEFKELQLQLGQISNQKFNGISLFSNQIPEVLFGEAVGLEFVNTESSHSRIMDADIALESARFARNNVLVQASAEKLVQSNQLTDIALTLFGN